MEKLYWKGRKIKKNLIFHIKAFLHKRSDKLAVKKDKELAEGIKSCAQVSNEIY